MIFSKQSQKSIFGIRENIDSNQSTMFRVYYWLERICPVFWSFKRLCFLAESPGYSWTVFKGFSFFVPLYLTKIPLYRSSLGDTTDPNVEICFDLPSSHPFQTSKLLLLCFLSLRKYAFLFELLMTVVWWISRTSVKECHSVSGVWGSWILFPVSGAAVKALLEQGHWPEILCPCNGFQFYGRHPNTTGQIQNDFLALLILRLH